MTRCTLAFLALCTACGGRRDEHLAESGGSASASVTDSQGEASEGTSNGSNGSTGSASASADGMDEQNDEASDPDEGPDTGADTGTKLDVGFPGTGDTGGTGECMDGRCAGCNAVDLLFVIDNSGSMNDYQVALGQAFPGFADAIFAALPPGVSLHVGVTSTEMGYSSSGATTNCTASGELLMPQEAFYVTPDDTDTGRVGAQGRLYPAQGMPYYEIDSDAGAAELQGLKDWFAAAANIGEGGSNIEMATAAAGWAADPVNTNGPNAGFLRDDGAVLVVFFIQDEPDQSDAPGMTMPETGLEMLATIESAKEVCGGLDCVVSGGFVQESCLPQNALGAFFDGLPNDSPIEELPPEDELDPADFAPLLEQTLAQVIIETCAEIEPEG